MGVGAGGDAEKAIANGQSLRAARADEVQHTVVARRLQPAQGSTQDADWLGDGDLRFCPTNLDREDGGRVRHMRCVEKLIDRPSWRPATTDRRKRIAG